jgi:hypothetical protein
MHARSAIRAALAAGLLGAAAGALAGAGCSEEKPVIPPCRQGEACSRTQSQWNWDASSTDPRCPTQRLVDRLPAEAGLQAECVVRERVPTGDAGFQERLLAACADPATPPCWALVSDDICGSELPHFEFHLDGPLPAGSELEAICSTCPPPSKDPAPAGCE